MEFDMVQLGTMFLALSIGAVVKGATGMGLPLVALPVIASVMGLQHAVGLMTIPLILTNVMQVWRFRDTAREEGMGFMPAFLVTCAVGVVLGTWALTSFPERALLFTLGVIILGYIALKLAAPHLVVSASLAQKTSPFVGTATGILHGATGISAPIGVTYIHAMGFRREKHLFAVSAMFLLLSAVQLPALFVAGVMRPEWLLQGILALVPILVFMPVGQALAGKLSRKAFDRMILIFLGVMGLKMLLGL
jgi:uncharacterized membrane protein YfcA